MKIIYIFSAILILSGIGFMIWNSTCSRQFGALQNSQVPVPAMKIVPVSLEISENECTLTNPATDMKYLFPEMTSFKEEVFELEKFNDGKKRYDDLKARLGSDLFEKYNTLYTIYSAYKGAELLGFVHGVSVPGKGGVIQVFLATNPQSGEIKKLFFQRIESPAAKALKNKDFRAQFSGLSLTDFYMHDYFMIANPGSEYDQVSKISNPAGDENGGSDFRASMRGVRKNLMLLDMLVYERKCEPFFELAQSVRNKVEI